jgi:hypothetical protein
MLSLNSFSQTDTTKVCIPTKVARQAAKDLVRYDGCKEELKLTLLKVEKLQEKEAQKDTIIKLLTEKDNTNQFIIQQKDLQIGQYEHLADDLTKEIKQKRRSTFLWKVATGAATLLSVFLIIK